MAEFSSFEDEILGLNPEYDLVFSKYNENNSRSNSPHALEPNTRLSSQHKMKIISKMNEIINAKPIGELPTQHDWDDQLTAEMETITLMRKLGLEQSVDRAPDEQRTIATVPISDDVIVMKNGRKKMSIFMADSFFELKPRSEPSFDLDDDTPPPTIEESTTSDFSEDVNVYQPIFESSVESTSLSDDTSNKSQPGVTSDSLSSESLYSDKRKSLKSQRKSSANLKAADCSTRSGASSGRKKQKGWCRLKDISDERDDKNWRLNVSKDEKTTPKLELKSNENNEQPIVSDAPKQEQVSSCGRTMYTPKDLFMKKKAMMVQQVLAEYKS